MANASPSPGHGDVIVHNTCQLSSDFYPHSSDFAFLTSFAAGSHWPGKSGNFRDDTEKMTSFVLPWNVRIGMLHVLLNVIF